MRLVLAIAFLFLLFCTAIPAAPRSVAVNKNLSLDLAVQAAQAAIENCATKGYTVSATVVDASGIVIASLRADGTGPHTVSTSRRKAYTSASAKNATSAMLATSQSNPGAAHLGDIDEFLLLGGGLPVRSGGSVVGGIGVGGAPSGAIDETCAQAGLDKIATAL